VPLLVETVHPGGKQLPCSFTDSESKSVCWLPGLFDLGYHYCCSSSQEFPLAIVSLNVTTWALRALRAGKLDKAARQLGGHMAAANHFYCGALLEFHTRCDFARI